MLEDATRLSLLESLYASALRPSSTGEFLALLGKATRSHCIASTQVAADERGRLRLLECDFGGPEDVRQHFLGMFDDCPEKLCYERSAAWIRPGIAPNGASFASPEEIMRSEYYHRVLSRMDIVHSAAMCGVQVAGVFSVITPCRTRSAGEFSAADMALMNWITPHWVNASLLTSRFGRHEARAEHAFALFTLDAQWRIVSTNGLAESLLQQGSCVARQGGRLHAPDARTEAKWRQRRLEAERGAAVLPPFPVRDKTGTLVAHAVLGPVFATGPDQTRYHLFVRPLSLQPDAGLAQALQDEFGLTLAESKLAVAIHTHGELALAADELGIKPASARQRLQSIFDKLGVHRQQELCRTLEAVNELLQLTH